MEVWQRVIEIYLVLCVEVADIKFMVFVKCCVVAACFMYRMCTVCWCGSVLYVWCRYCVVVWERVICMVCVLCGVLPVCHRYDVCTVWWCSSVLYV